MTEKTFDTIISALINEKINAEKCNKYGINNEFIKNINSALEELKKMNPNNNEVENPCYHCYTGVSG